MSYIKQQPSGKWRAQVERHGMKASKVTKTKREAQEWARDKELDLDELKGSNGMTFAQASAKYLETAAKEKAPGAADWERRRLEECAEYFGENTPLVTISGDKLGEWRNERLKTVSGSTVIRHFSVLRCLFREAHEDLKILPNNPCKGVRMPEHNPARHQVWTWQLIKRVLRAQNRNEREIETIRAFHIALHTGMRLNEILVAKLVGKIALLERDKNSGKASPPVKVPLARKGAALFAKYPPFTIRPDIASATFSDMTDELLIDGLTFHDTRGSALTWLSRRMDVMTLARISRHKNLKTLLDTYYRESAESIADRI